MEIARQNDVNPSADGLTCGPARTGPTQAFRFLSVGSTRGYSWYAASGHSRPRPFRWPKLHSVAIPHFGDSQATQWPTACHLCVEKLLDFFPTLE